MPCYKPLDAWRDRSGKVKKLIFSYSPSRCAGPTPDLQVPCGQCVGCRLERSRQWAIRCVHEAQLHSCNCFITLTYDDSRLPPGYDIKSGLVYKHFQDFMKRLRKKYGSGIRFYMCGEYGENLGRPHFHACLFGHDFDDRKLWKITGSKSRLYRSDALEQLWSFGFSSVGDVTFESAAYVARYIMKKVTGEAAERHYKFFRPFNRGDIRAPSRVHRNVVEAGDCRPLVSDVFDGCFSS